MIKNSENEITVNGNKSEKKDWYEPQIIQLDLKETKGGAFALHNDSGSWFPNLQS